MKKLVTFVLFFSLFMFTSVVHSAESVTQALQSGGEINVLQISWTTDASGNLTATDTAYPLEGYLMLVETDPDGSAAPTDNYDIVLNDANGLDVMGGALSDRDTANTEATMPKLNGSYTMIPVPGTLEMDVTNAGNSKSGVIRIYFVR